jgi:hypothetical protein
MEFFKNLLNKLKKKKKVEDTPINEVGSNTEGLTLIKDEEVDKITERLIDVSNKPLKLEKDVVKAPAKKAAKKVAKKAVKKAKPSQPKSQNIKEGDDPKEVK